MAANPANKLRVMLDANIVLSGIGWPRFPYEVLRHAVAGDFQLVLSTYVISEVREHIARILPDRIAELDKVLEASQYEEVPAPSIDDLAAFPNLVRDEKDIPVAVAAIKAKVNCLISLDKDLTEPSEPIHQYLKVMLPGTFLREYMGWGSDQLSTIHKRTWNNLSLDDET